MREIAYSPEELMRLAIREAKKAERNGDVPIGCLIVYDGRLPGSRADQRAEEQSIRPGEIIGRGYNRRNRDKSALKHAEISAISKACRRLGDWRLEDCTMIVTLEPCPMCAGAILQARIPRLLFGAENPKAGFCGSVLDILQLSALNHRVELLPPVLREDCKRLMTDFFGRLRAHSVGEE